MEQINYNDQLKELTENFPADNIVNIWSRTKGLFKIVGFPDHVPHISDYPNDAGCLTMIAKGNHYAYINGEKNFEVTEAIRSDNRIPSDPRDIKPENLPVFKEWQEKVDMMSISKPQPEIY